MEATDPVLLSQLQFLTPDGGNSSELRVIESKTSAVRSSKSTVLTTAKTVMLELTTSESHIQLNNGPLDTSMSTETQKMERWQKDGVLGSTPTSISSQQWEQEDTSTSSRTDQLSRYQMAELLKSGSSTGRQGQLDPEELHLTLFKSSATVEV